MRIDTIHTVPGLVDWMGVYYEENLIRIYPSIDPQASSTAVGCILLVDLARDLISPTSYNEGKLSLANIHDLDQHMMDHFGTKLGAFTNGKPIGSVSNRLLATYLTKTLKSNHIDQADLIEASKSRIRFKAGPVLLNVHCSTIFSGLADLAEWLGKTYRDLSCQLIA